jgi:hypothetical protein
LPEPRRITRLDPRLITQKKVASDRTDEVYEASKRWLVLNAVIAHIKWLGLKRQMTQNEPELYLEDEVYADAIARNIVPFPVRFDYSSDVEKFVDVDHPYSHMSLGQYKNCRIPACSPIGPLVFGGFIFRNFYNTAFRKYSEQIPVSDVWFPKSITDNERRIPHVVCSP